MSLKTVVVYKLVKDFLFLISGQPTNNLLFLCLNLILEMKKYILILLVRLKTFL